MVVPIVENVPILLVDPNRQFEKTSIMLPALAEDKDISQPPETVVRKVQFSKKLSGIPVPNCRPYRFSLAVRLITLELTAFVTSCRPYPAFPYALKFLTLTYAFCKENPPPVVEAGPF
jgi:hypothetical protein